MSQLDRHLTFREFRHVFRSWGVQVLGSAGSQLSVTRTELPITTYLDGVHNGQSRISREIVRNKRRNLKLEPKKRTRTHLQTFLQFADLDEFYDAPGRDLWPDYRDFDEIPGGQVEYLE